MSYDYHVSYGRGNSEAETIYNHLNGYGDDGVFDRTIHDAASACDSIRQEANDNWVLAPTVVSWEPEESMVFHDPGPFAVQVEFDCDMNTNELYGGILKVLNGYIVEPGQVPFISGPQWLGSNVYTAAVVPIHCPGPVPVVIRSSGASSAVGGHQLDGGSPGWGVGEGPNRDSFWWQFYTDASQTECDIWATSFGPCGAFEEAGQTTVYWAVDFQRGTTGFDIYAGDGRSMSLVRTVAAAIVDPDRPAGYSVTIPSIGEVVEIVERDARGRETRSRPFSVGDRPAELGAILNVGADYGALERGGTRPEHGLRGGGPMPVVEHPWYIFVSSRPEFLAACAPAIDRLETLGRPTDTVLTTKDPNDIWTVLYPYWTLWNPGYVRPRVILVGQAYEDVASPKNILGTYYSPDSTGICYYGNSCVRDAWLVDFDCDDIPDLPWTRIDADNLIELQNSVQGFVDVLNGAHISSPGVFILDGDMEWCNPITEPDASLQAVKGLYEAHGIPTTLVRDSDFADCYDLAGRQTAAIGAVQSGITEMVGTGYVSNRNKSPALLIQNDYSPRWTMDLVPRQQRVVAWFPGCDFGDGDRAGVIYTPMVELWTTAPPSGTQAVYWTSHGRGAWGRAHLRLLREVMEWRFSGLVWDCADATFRAIRSLAEEQPGLVDYLGTVHCYGWPVNLPDFPAMPTIEQVEVITGRTELLAARPNPFTDEARLWYNLGRSGQVVIDIADVSGRIVNRLVDEWQEAGPHGVVWSGTDREGRRVAAGAYFVRAVLDGERRTGRFILAP